jgi:hypothetical protein
MGSTADGGGGCWENCCVEVEYMSIANLFLTAS